MPSHFGDVFAQVARGVLWRGRQRGMALCFDFAGPDPLVRADDIALRCGLHRLCVAVQDLAGGGLMMMDGRLRPSRSGLVRMTVRLSAAGVPYDDDAVDGILQRLDLAESGTDAPLEGGRPRLRRATGICPCTGAAISLAHAPAQGVVVVAEQSLAVERSGAPEHPAHARIDGPCWIVTEDFMPAHALALRLRRLGWADVRVLRPVDALRRLRARRAKPAPDGIPATLMLIHSIRGDEPAAAASLSALLPAATKRLLGVTLGSPWLSHGAGPPGYEVAPLPFSPSLLRRWRQAASAVDGTVPEPPPAPRRPVLVVDDEPINRALALQMLLQLGEHAEEATDGLQAIARCRASHPGLVLMDVEMPRLDGLEATRMLRDMQAAGEVAPCPILAATASLDHDVDETCRAAGMDDTMRKPLDLGVLRSRIERYCPAG
jgi:CheY-like chemotaxis protein